MLWINETEEDVKKRMMSGVNQSLGGTATEDSFWLTDLKRNKSNPQKRYEAAFKGLPLPAAFREAALGLRAVIREKSKNGQVFEKELEDLYRIAVWRSFSRPYSERAKITGFRILERIPGGVIANLDYNYQDMGYEKLELLNKTDIKYLVELWGEPKTHKTLLDVYTHIWEKYEDDYIHIINSKGYSGLYDIEIKGMSDESDTNTQDKPSIFGSIFQKIFK